MIKIPLTKGYFALVDDIDAPRVLAMGSWSFDDRKYNGVNYAKRSVRGKTVYLHRFIMDSPRGKEVDHRDGDGLNCSRFNLRLASSSQNKCNRRRSKTNKSGFKGVYFEKSTGKWMVSISINKKRTFIGRFDSRMKAGKAYDAFAIKLHGSFARLNFSKI